jgi:hypothetical protein
MRRFIFFGAVLAIGVLTTPVSADNIIPSGVLSSTPDGADFDYTITLSNSSASTNSIGTFWFAWVPGKDFMATSPLSVTDPTGWTDHITHGGSTDGYAIQWVSSSLSDNVAIGGSLTFQFTSADTPAQIAGNSQFYPTIPVETSFVYSGAPFSDAGFVFQVSSVPEPSTLTLGILALLSSYAYSRFRRKKAMALPAVGDNQDHGLMLT